MTPDPRVDAYIGRAQPFARPILQHVRERVGAAVPAAEETVKWGAPAYTLDGKILLIAAAFKQHAALNFWRGAELRGSDSEADGMGQFGKLKSVDDLPPARELDRLIKEAAELAKKAPVKRVTKASAKPEPELHPAFASALRAAPKAKANFEAFSPSCRREYMEWVAEAKRDETRDKRIATAIEWLSEGKKRNWRYEKC